MPTLTIKNVPKELIEAIKELAERHRRDLNNEAIVLLENGALRLQVERQLDKIRAQDEAEADVDED